MSILMYIYIIYILFGLSSIKIGRKDCDIPPVGKYWSNLNEFNFTIQCGEH